jgi:hypothetical protein
MKNHLQNAVICIQAAPGAQVKNAVPLRHGKDLRVPSDDKSQSLGGGQPNELDWIQIPAEDRPVVMGVVPWVLSRIPQLQEPELVATLQLKVASLA